jgi:hypothetical protein
MLCTSGITEGLQGKLLGKFVYQKHSRHAFRRGNPNSNLAQAILMEVFHCISQSTVENGRLYFSADHERFSLNPYLKAIQDHIFHVIQSCVTTNHYITEESINRIL